MSPELGGPDMTRPRCTFGGRLATMAGVCVLLIGGTLALASPAFANNGAAMNVNVDTATVSMQPMGSTCDWTVTSDVTIIDLLSSPLDISAVSPFVSYIESSGPSGVVSDVTIVDAAGLVPGDTVAPGGQSVYRGFEVTFSLPCAANSGDLDVQITTQEGSGSGDAPFLADGSPLPPAAVGAVGLGVISSGVFLISLRRHRRRRLAATPVT